MESSFGDSCEDFEESPRRVREDLGLPSKFRLFKGLTPRERFESLFEYLRPSQILIWLNPESSNFFMIQDEENLDEYHLGRFEKTVSGSCWISLPMTFKWVEVRRLVERDALIVYLEGALKVCPSVHSTSFFNR